MTFWDYIKDMWENRRLTLILYVAGYIAVMAFFVGIIYIILFRGMSPGNNVNNTNVTVNGGLPNTNDATFVNGDGADVNTNTSASLPKIDTVAGGSDTLVSTLVDSSTIDGVRVANGLVSYYDAATGFFYNIGPSGEAVRIGDAFFPEASNVQWSPTKDQVIFTLPDGNNVFYDLETGEQANLPVEMADIRFSPTGNNIAYKYFADNEDNRFLGIAEPDGSGITVIEALGSETNDVQVNWSPTSQIIATFRDTVDAKTQKVFFIGREGENFEDLQVDGRGFQGIWSPSGKQMLYSVYSQDSDFKPRLWIANADGGDATGTGKLSLGIETYADKCTFAKETTVYCAVPQNLESGSGLYRELADDTTDRFYSIDLSTGRSNLIANPVHDDGSNDIRAIDLQLSDNGDTLYFINEETGSLESIALK